MEEDLVIDLMVLQSHLDGLLDRMHTNNITLRRFQMFEMGLLELNSLAEMLEYVLNSQDFFDLDYIGFCLIDTKNEIKKFLSEDGFDLEAKTRLIIFENSGLIKPAFGRSMTPYIGPYKIEKCANFFVIEKSEPASVTIIPFIRKGKIIGALCLGSFDPDRFVNSMSTDFIEHMTSVLGVCLENHLSYEAMKHTSFIDTLTGVNNRRFLEQRLSEEVDRAQRSIEALSCLFFDIDFFKKINDEYGHPAGDKVLKHIVSLTQDFLRESDAFCRWGGEEFLIVLKECNLDDAYLIAEKIRKAVAGTSVVYKGNEIGFKISLGVAQFHPGEDQECLFYRVDKLLYLAKDNGRNRSEKESSV